MLGFLVAGVAVGPHGLGTFVTQMHWLSYVTFTDVDSIAVLAEFGIVFLLFLIGLELSLDRLWSMRKLVLGLGSSQVLVTRTIPELAESSLQMGAFVLMGLGIPMDAVNTVCDRVRDRGYEGLQVSRRVLMILRPDGCGRTGYIPRTGSSFSVRARLNRARVHAQLSAWLSCRQFRRSPQAHRFVPVARPSVA